MLDLAIVNGTVVNHDGSSEVNLGIKDERIAMLSMRGELPGAQHTIDASGRYVVPGAIDPHVHLGFHTDLGSDFETETRSAALGGVTLMKHMLTSDGSYSAPFETTRKLGESHSFIDFALDVEMRQDLHVSEIPEYDRLGISSYKFFLTYKGSDVVERGIRPCDDGYLYAGLRAIAAVGRPATARVHCEAIEIISRLSREVRTSGADGLKAFMDSRPPFVEAVDASRVSWLAGYLGCPVCIVHVSSAESVNVIAHAKAKGIDILGETCPHYLHFTWESPLGALLAMTPSIKDHEDIDRLWRGIRESTIGSIGSDHVWLPLQGKMAESVWSTIGGVGGVGIMFPFILSEGVGKGRISLDKRSRSLPFGLQNGMGSTLEKGSFRLGHATST